MVRSVDGLTTKVLNGCLRKNLDFGIINRVAYPEIPPSVEYEITAFGRKFIGSLDQIESPHANSKPGDEPVIRVAELCTADPLIIGWTSGSSAPLSQTLLMNAKAAGTASVASTPTFRRLAMNMGVSTRALEGPAQAPKATKNFWPSAGFLSVSGSGVP
jgi:hypothetical protein